MLISIRGTACMCVRPNVSVSDLPSSRQGRGCVGQPKIPGKILRGEKNNCLKRDAVDGISLETGGPTPGSASS